MIKICPGEILEAVLKKSQGWSIPKFNKWDCCLSLTFGHRPVLQKAAGLAQAGNESKAWWHRSPWGQLVVLKELWIGSKEISALFLSDSVKNLVHGWFQQAFACQETFFLISKETDPEVWWLPPKQLLDTLGRESSSVSVKPYQAAHHVSVGAWFPRVPGRVFCHSHPPSKNSAMKGSFRNIFSSKFVWWLGVRSSWMINKQFIVIKGFSKH